MGLRSLNFSARLWLLPLAALASAPAASAVPAKEAVAKAAAVQPEPRPALWLLADEDTRIYMLGTIHVLPPGFRWRSKAVDRAVGESAELVVETYEPPGSDRSLASAPGFFQESPVPLLKRVPKSRRKALKAAIEASRLPLPVLDRMHSWAAAMTLGVTQMLDEYGVEAPDEAPGVEDVLEETFRSAGKPISGVEDDEAIYAALSALPEAVQVQLLLDAIAPVPEPVPGAPSPAGELDWVAGNDKAMSLENEGFPPALFDVLVRRRNAAWTEWLEARLKTPGTLLFAVGAGHLAGPESVQAMLARRGLRVTRVD